MYGVSLPNYNIGDYASDDESESDVDSDEDDYTSSKIGFTFQPTYEPLAAAVELTLEDQLIQGLGEYDLMVQLISQKSLDSLNLSKILSENTDGADSKSIELLVSRYNFDLTPAVVLSIDMDSFRTLLRHPDRINLAQALSMRTDIQGIQEILNYKDRINMEDAVYWGMLRNNIPAVNYIVQGGYITNEQYTDIYNLWSQTANAFNVPPPTS
jgi:hypothetical protein